MSDRPLVLLLREPDDGNAYAAALEEAGFDAAFAPVLEFEIRQNAPLAERLTRPAEYRGLILTSPRAVAALARHAPLLPPWRRHRTYAVGPETARRLRALGFAPAGEDCGTAARLANLVIAETHPADLPLLFLAGNRRRDVLPDALGDAGVRFEEVTVYSTELVAPVLPEREPDWVVFFSPSGVEAARLAPAFPWNTARTAAIGPTTADALRQRGFSAVAVADAPEPAALCRALLAANQTARASQTPNR